MEQEWFNNQKWWFGCSSNIDNYLTDKYEHLLNNNKEKTDIELILLYDQLPRHIFRNQQCNHIIEYYLQKALLITNNLINSNKINDLDVNRFCFALLPLRHTNINKNIYTVLDYSWNRLKYKNELEIIRFIKATYQNIKIYEEASLIYKKNNFNNKIENKEVFDLNFNTLDYDLKNKNIIISLSGGVDSMLCSLYLIHKFPKYKISALFINYNNRNSSNDEEIFVKNWCKKINIDLYSRKIHEIQRAPCMKFGLRDIYETYTRNVRYNCYKQFGKNSIIVLGHNKDDILENIFTNICHQNKYENLNGMTELSNVDNITFWRPLLNISKNEIYKLAEKYNIPHLPCSTPIWSQRGQIRNNIVPVLNNWDNKFIDSMYQLSTNVKNLYSIMNDYIDTILIINNDKIKFKINNYSLIFWRCLFLKLNIIPSNKSIINLCNRIDYFKKQDKIEKIQINITKIVYIIINKNLECQVYK